MVQTLLIAFGGALGTVARYWIAVLAAPVSRSLPWGTIIINIVGSFAIGLFGTLTIHNGRYPLPETARLFFMVGVCGGFTTFSSFSLQTLDLLRDGAVPRAAANVILSVVLCVAAATAGYAIGRHFNGGVQQMAENIVEES